MINEPIFKDVFGDDWEKLPPVIRKHYANRAYSSDVVIVEGILDVMCRWPVKMLGWFLSLVGSIPPYSKKNVPVTVHFRSDANTRRFHFERIFYFSNLKPYSSKSYMYQVRNNEVVEVSALGMCWHMRYVWKDGKVVMNHKRYALKFFGIFIPLPFQLLLGKAYAEETPIDDNTFDMCMHMTHPIWGRTYEYKGRFKVTKEA